MAKFSIRMYSVCREVKSLWVINGFDIENVTFFREVLLRYHETATSVQLACVERGSIIITDCWTGFVNLKKLGHQHLAVNYSRNFVKPTTYANAQAI